MGAYWMHEEQAAEGEAVAWCHLAETVWGAVISGRGEGWACCRQPSVLTASPRGAGCCRPSLGEQGDLLAGREVTEV